MCAGRWLTSTDDIYHIDVSVYPVQSEHECITKHHLGRFYFLKNAIRCCLNTNSNSNKKDHIYIHII